MKVTWKKTWQAIKRSVLNDFSSYSISKLSAALAYYTIFSLAPLVIIMISIAGFFYGESAIEGKIYEEFNVLVGEQASLQIQNIIKTATLSGSLNRASIWGIIGLLLSAAGIFSEMQSSVNIIWNIKTKAKKAIRKLILNRLLSFLLVIGMGFIVVLFLIINTILDATLNRIIQMLPYVSVYVGYIVNQIIVFLFLSFLFALIFKFMPDMHLKWSYVRMGAFITAFLFMIGKLAISFYISHSKVASAFGAAGSVVILLLWVYYSSIIVYLGVAITKNYCSLSNIVVYPKDYAVLTMQVEAPVESFYSLTSKNN
jgi:membrane protein